MLWENYFLKEGADFRLFWSTYLVEKPRNLLFIMGMGFDPRTIEGIKEIYSIKGEGKRDTITLRYFKNQEEINETPLKDVNKHIEELTNFLNTHDCPPFMVKNVIQRSPDDNSITSISSSRLIDEKEIAEYSDIIVDISAMPRTVFLPLLNKLLVLVNGINKQKNSGEEKKNLHVIVTENSFLDSHIHDRGESDEANYIHGISITETAKTQNQKEVWIPLLGEGQSKQYDTIRKDIDPVEICPVLPFPSDDLKRSDKLMVEYQDYLLNDDSFDPKNIIYAHEHNPFQVYRLIYSAIKRYDRSLKILDGCKVIVSVFSSKLLTIGAFLAVFESRLEDKNTGIKHVETISQELDDDIVNDLERILSNNRLVELWLTGTPYEDEN